MCTNFSFTSSQNEPFIGRTMELGPDLGSELFFRPQNHRFSQIPEETTLDAVKIKNAGIVPLENLKDITGVASWVGKYGFVAMNAFSQDIVADGMNTEGLTTGCMVFTGSEYQVIPEDYMEGKDVSDEEANMLYYTNLTNWILSSCANCQDVINQLIGVKLVKPDNSTLQEPQDSTCKKFVVTSPFSEILNAFKFHFPVHDAKGQNIVLEYIKGELIITDLAPINVLTNDPEISWQQTNVLNNYIGITPYNVQDDCGYSISIDAEKIKNPAGDDTCILKPEQDPKTAPPVFNCKTFAQGTGFAGIPGSSTPVDRFVRAAMMTNFALKANSEADDSDPSEGDAVTLAFHILNTVDIPMGTSRDATGWNDPDKLRVHDYTQWSTVSNLKKKEYSIRMYKSPQVFLVKLCDLNLDELVDTRYKIPTDNKSVNITQKDIKPKAL
jgi:penicillin V acylase-like amidase (Ntn superfamily)